MAGLFASSKWLSTSSSVSHGIGTGDFTVCAWVYAISSVVGNAGFWTNGSFAPLCAAKINDGSGKFGIYLSGYYAFNSTISTGAWYHLAVKRSGTTLSGFVNGTKEATTHTVSTSISDAISNIGVDATAASSYWDGYIAEVGLWTAAKSDGMIAGLAKGMSPSCDRNNLKLYHPILRTLTQCPTGQAFTNTGTVTVADHPRIYMPRRTKARRFTTAAAGGTTTARLIQGGLINGGKLLGGRLIA